MENNTGSTWLSNAGRFRLPVKVSVTGFERIDKPAEIEVDFSAALSSVNEKASFNEKSIRVVEVNETGEILDENVSFQFDRAEGFDAAVNARGALVLMLSRVTPAGASRLYQVYFDVAGYDVKAAEVAPQVSITDNIHYEGQDSYKIVTKNATYYYHKQGAGFASMIDNDGNDWISYHPGGGSAGEYRGIPNAGHPEKYFHPGGGTEGAVTAILSQGPLKIKIFSESEDKKWSCIWEIYPTYAKLTMLKVGHNYWFLYEGTPGGKLDLEKNYCVWSNGNKISAAEPWQTSLPEPEWVYFADGKISRAIFLAHHEYDGVTDSYWPMNKEMTVFGTGRPIKGLHKYHELLPSHFTIGFSESSEYEEASKLVNSCYRDLTAAAGEVESRK